MRYSNNRKFKKLSAIAENLVEDLDWNEKIAEIDDIYSSERCDMKCDLNAVMIQRNPRFLGKNEDFRNLSKSTILEGQLIDMPKVQKVVSKVNLEWRKARSLCLLGKSNFKRYVHKPIKRVVKTNKSVDFCDKEFQNELRKYFKDYYKNEENKGFLDYIINGSCYFVKKISIKYFLLKLEEQYESLVKYHENEKFPSSKNTKFFEKVDSSPHFPKISDFTYGLINDVLMTKKISAYDHLNVQYLNKIDNTIKNMNIHNELEGIIQQEIKTTFQVPNPDETSKFTYHNYNFKKVDENLDKFNKIQMSVKSVNEHKEVSKRSDDLSNGKNKNTYDADLEKPYKDKYFKGSTEGSSESSKRKSFYSKFDENFLEKKKKSAHDDNVDKKKEDCLQKNYLKSVFPQESCDELKSFEKYRKERINRSDIENTFKIQYDEFDLNGQNYSSVELKKKRKKLNDERKKKKKEEKKHKKKKRNKHKDKMEFREKDEKNERPMKFHPNPRFYFDSDLSFCLDVYQFKELKGHESVSDLVQQAPTKKLDLNFEEYFDPSKAPSIFMDSPLMRMFLDTSDSLHMVSETISHMKDFNIDVVNDKNSFLWSLVLTSLDQSYSIKLFDTEADLQGSQINNKKSGNKSSSNPLIQAFKQAVEANKNKQKDEKSVSTGTLRPSKYLLMGNMGSGLKTLFRLQSNLKAGTRDMVKEVTESFQKDLQKFIRKQSIVNSIDFFSPPIMFDFSDSLDHFRSISSLTHKLYTEAEFKLSQRFKLNKYNKQYKKYGNYSVTEPANGSDTFPTTHPKEATKTTKTIVENSSSDSSQTIKSNVNYYTSSHQITTVATTPTVESTETPHLSNQQNYNYYSTYNPYTWTYMHPYGMPTYSSNYFHPFYSHYPSMVYPTYNFAGNLPASSNTVANTSSVFSDSSSNLKLIRYHVFMLDSPETLIVEKHLENMGLKKFDPFNISLLNYIANIECQIFIHQSSLPFIHYLPNLLNLKRDPRVMFAEFSDSNEVIDKMFRVVFPRGGVVLLDLSVILSSNPEVLEALFQHLSNNTNDDVPWNIIVSQHVPVILQKLSAELEESKFEEKARLKQLQQVLFSHQSQGSLQLMTNFSQRFSQDKIEQQEPFKSQNNEQAKLDDDESKLISETQKKLDEKTQTTEHLQTADQSFTSDPLTIQNKQSTEQDSMSNVSKEIILPKEINSDYYDFLLRYQAENLHTYRHFVFITDMPRDQQHMKTLLSSGIEVFNVTDFMKVFASQNISYEVKSFEGFATLEMPTVYADAVPSICSQCISF